MLRDADPNYFKGIYIVCGYTDLRYKRVESGHFSWPRSSDELRSMNAEQFRWLMQGFSIDPVIRDVFPCQSA